MARPTLLNLPTPPSDASPTSSPCAPVPVGAVERALARMLRASEEIKPLFDQMSADPAQLALLRTCEHECAARGAGGNAAAHREVQALSAEVAELALDLERKQCELAERDQLVLELRDARLRAETRAERFEHLSQELSERVDRLCADLLRRRPA